MTGKTAHRRGAESAEKNNNHVFLRVLGDSAVQSETKLRRCRRAEHPKPVSRS
jgi:hypothetical protein